jgi:AraC-like DNA-binding protein
MDRSALTDMVITGVHSASTLFSPEDKGGKRQERACWAVVLKYEGQTHYRCRDKDYLSDAYHPVILPKGCSYDWKCIKAGRFSVVEFESNAVGTEPIVFTVSSSEKLLKLFKELEYKRNLKTAITELESIRDTYSIILTLLQTQKEPYVPSKKRQKIDAAIEYISRNYHKKLSNDQLATMVGLSTVYFRKLFTITVGVSPIVYAHSLRIEKAKEILKSDYTNLSDVALSLGYSSLYDFSRAFKNHTGVSPSRYCTK